MSPTLFCSPFSLLAIFVFIVLFKIFKIISTKYCKFAQLSQVLTLSSPCLHDHLPVKARYIWFLLKLIQPAFLNCFFTCLTLNGKARRLPYHYLFRNSFMIRVWPLIWRTLRSMKGFLKNKQYGGLCWCYMQIFFCKRFCFSVILLRTKQGRKNCRYFFTSKSEFL